MVSDCWQNRSSTAMTIRPPVGVRPSTRGVTPQSGFSGSSGVTAGVKVSGVSRLLSMRGASGSSGGAAWLVPRHKATNTTAMTPSRLTQKLGLR